MGVFRSKVRVVEGVEEPQALTPIAETLHAQICCKTDAMKPGNAVPEAEKYVVRPKNGVCIQAKPRVYSGKVYYVVGMVGGM